MLNVLYSYSNVGDIQEVTKNFDVSFEAIQ